jgi:hypothetical protein
VSYVIARAGVSPIARLSMSASAVAGAIGVVFIALMYAAFAAGAHPAGLMFGWINDLAVLLQFLLAIPGVVAVGASLRKASPRLSRFGTPMALAAMGVIVVFQLLLVTGVLTFEQEIGFAGLGLLVLGAWMIAAALAGGRSGIAPAGPGLAILAALYVGYPLWAWRVSRWMEAAPDDSGPDRKIVAAAH